MGWLKELDSQFVVIKDKSIWIALLILSTIEPTSSQSKCDKSFSYNWLETA